MEECLVGVEWVIWIWTEPVELRTASFGEDDGEPSETHSSSSSSSIHPGTLEAILRGHWSLCSERGGWCV